MSTKKNKNWIIIDNEILRFGDLSAKQRLRNIEVNHDEAYLRCVTCNHEKKVVKIGTRWDLGTWQASLGKSIVKKDNRGYFIESPIHFFCAREDCLKSLALLTLAPVII